MTNFMEKFSELINPNVPRHFPIVPDRIMPFQSPTPLPPPPADGFIAKYCTDKENVAPHP